MLLSSLTYRTPSQRAITVVKAWTVDGGSWELTRIIWDPQGPLSATEAAAQSLERAAAALRGKHRDDASGKGGVSNLDQPLPGL